MQGDVKISSNDGNIISSKRFMGPNVELETEGGDIRGNRNNCEINNLEKIISKFLNK